MSFKFNNNTTLFTGKQLLFSCKKFSWGSLEPLCRGFFFTAKGSFPYGCNNHMVVDQTWSRKLVAVTRLIACYSQKKVDVNKSKTNLSNCVLCNFHHILKKSYNIQYIRFSNYKIWKFPLKYLKQPVPLVIL